MSQELVCPGCGHKWSARTSVDTRKRTKCPKCGLYATSTRFVQKEAQEEPEEPEAPEPGKAPKTGTVVHTTVNVDPQPGNESFISFSDLEFENTSEERASKTEDDIEIEDEQASTGPPPIDPATYNPVLLEIIEITTMSLGVELTPEERSRIKTRATNLELRYQAMQNMANNNVMVWLLFFICIASILVPKIVQKFKEPKKKDEKEKKDEKREVKVEWKDVPKEAKPAAQPQGAFDARGLY